MTTFQKARKKQIDPVSQVFIWFAGVDIKILQQMDSPVDISKYTASGIMAVIACLFAGFSAFIFIMSVLITDIYGISGSHLKIVFSLIWGVFIFAVDRFLLTSFKKKEFSWNRLKDVQFISSLVFRFSLCFVISSFVATEIELYVFSSAISQQLQILDTQEITTKQDAASKMIYSESPNIVQIDADIKKIENDIQDEKKNAKNWEKN